MRASARLHGTIVACVAGLLGLAACHAPEEAATIVSWTFADARSCIDSGVGYIEIGSTVDDRDWGYFDCSDGAPPGSITLAGVRDRGEELQLSAVSWQGALLYQGRTTSPLPRVAQVTLYAVEAQ